MNSKMRVCGPSLWRTLLSALTLAAFLVSCGGGGVGEGGTGSFASGPISGFGSVHVAGIRFDTRGIASVQWEDGETPPLLSALQPGMVIAVEAGPIRTDAAGVRRAVAERLVLAGSLRGPVTDVQWGLRRLRVLGLPVRFNGATVFDEALREQIRESGQLREQEVEVWGYVDRSSVVPEFVATFVASAEGTAFYKARGFVRAVVGDVVQLGDELFDFSAVAGRPAVGDFVRLRVATSDPDPAWEVIAWTRIERRDFEEGRTLEIEGRVTAVIDANRFSVDGIPVVAAAVPGLVEGSYVEVEGRWRDGALQASEVDIKSDDELDELRSEWEGVVSGLDTVQRRFTLTTDSGQGVTVTYDDLTQFEGGTAGELGNGLRLEVKGTLRNGVLQAREIEFE
jgi:hypothetical protein